MTARKPSEVACPFCYARKGEECLGSRVVNRSGGTVTTAFFARKPHAARVRAAREGGK